MSSQKISFLGPEGTFAHLAARKRFGTPGRSVGKYTLVPAHSVGDVFDYVSSDKSALGVVPIENSSGGTIYDTVDRLVDEACPLFIQEALTVNVRLALVGKDVNNIRVIYSHFAPLHHCDSWLRMHFPKAELRDEPSTALAVKKAALESGAAAIGYREAAEIHSLKVLEFPIGPDIRNVTQFLVLGHNPILSKENSRTTLVFILPNEPGSLVDFLLPFKKNNVNLSRIISRPISGKPDTYVFLADVAGAEKQKNVKSAIKAAESVATHIRNIGSYPVRPPYES